MDRLCDEIVQLIFYELNDPSPLTRVSKRFYIFSQDPFIRAHYFLARYGPIQAIFYAFGRGRLLNERVLDILICSGAHLSRYLIQIAIHHYFRTQSHFIKTAWVRTVPFNVFSYFLQIAAQKYGQIPVEKNQDDGSKFALFLKESRFPQGMRSISWEDIKDILEKYKFIPFSNKDPIMAQFPLALAIEPRLLPLAVVNGFHMDTKYRDFVFRKMFERPATLTETRVDDIVHNVRELCRLDHSMFLSRTVAAEICMESKTNEAAYMALKRLDKGGELRFSLATLVEDLIKLFIKTRSITLPQTAQTLRQLFMDFPSPDPTARLVLLCTIFIQETYNCLPPPHNHASSHLSNAGSGNSLSTTENLKIRFEELGMVDGPSRRELIGVLLNPFVERYWPVMEWARWNGEPDERMWSYRDGNTSENDNVVSGSSNAGSSTGSSRRGRLSRRSIAGSSSSRPMAGPSKPKAKEGKQGANGLGYGPEEVQKFIEEVSEKLLEVACKGKMVKKLYERYDFVKELVARVVPEKHQIHVEDLPPWEDERACRTYEAKLSRDFGLLRSGTGMEGVELVAGERKQDSGSMDERQRRKGKGKAVDRDGEQDDTEKGRDISDQKGVDEVVVEDEDDESQLGHIGQDTLSTMIKQDELAPTRPRRRSYYMFNLYSDTMNKLPYPNDSVPVAKWVRSQFGARSRITAVFMTHAVINENTGVLNYYLGYSDPALYPSPANHVPVTLKHFQLLARLGRAPNWTLYNEIENGAEFFHTEDDYLSSEEVVLIRGLVKVKTESFSHNMAYSSDYTILPPSSPRTNGKSPYSPVRGRKRPRREAASTVRSYIVPDSDDEAIVGDDDDYEDMDTFMEPGRHAKLHRAETSLQRWIEHLSILLKEEQRKYKEKKRQVEKDSKTEVRHRFQKNDFFRSLSAQLRHLRRVDYERRLKLYGPENADVAYTDDDDDGEYVERTNTRVKKRKTVVLGS